MKSIFSVSRKALMALTAVVALLFVGGPAFAQSTIKGKVLDSNGEGIIGASVVVPGTTTGVITDIDGNFEIRVAPGTTLEVSCIGYVSQRVTAADNISVTLADDSLMLEEAVAVGYGTMKKSDVTGALVSVDSETLTQRPTNNVFEALQGHAAGVDIRSNERPGEVGSVYIRGQRSLTASSTPLYVVDGIPMTSGSIDNLNPQDIESIEILKDASSTAIYGSRGANGVILVTTKKGTKGEMHISYSGSFTYETIKDKVTWMTAGEYIDWRRTAYYNLNPSVYPSASNPTQENDYRIFNGGGDPYAWRNIMKGWAGGKWDGSKVVTTDWMSLILKPSITHEHTVSASGGSDKFQSYTSFGYLGNEGTIHGQDYKRFTLNSSNDYQPFKWLSFGASLNASYGIQNYGLSGAGNTQGGSQSSAYGVATQGYPYAVPFDDEGNRIEYPGGDDRVKNVYGEWDLQTDLRKTMRAVGSIYTQLNFGEMWEPLKGLSFRVNFGPDFRYTDRGLFVDGASFNRNKTNYAINNKQTDFSWTLDELLYYNREFGKHTVGLTLLHSADAWDRRTMNITAESLPIDEALWNNMGSVSTDNLKDYSTGLTQRQMESYMARINYSYDNRYLLTASVRRDGASVLAEGHKWAVFPSVALGWRIDQESFMQDVSWVNQLKLRAGWGITGNAAIDPYKTKGAIVSLFYPFGNKPTAGYTLFDSMHADKDARNLAMANEALTWEKTAQWNVGLDFNFLNGRISGVIDAYKSFTSDLLMEQPLPAILGYTRTYNNIGKTENVGVDLTLNFVPIRTQDWEWTIDINAAWTKNKITELANGQTEDLSHNWFVGYPLNVVYSYKSAGIWQASDAAEMAKYNANGNKFQPGMARPADIDNAKDKDGNPIYKIDANYDKVILGSTMPRWTFGFNTAVSYKSWTLTAQLYGRFKFLSGSDAPWVGGRYNVRKYDYWTEQNTGAKYTKPIFSEAGADEFYTTVDNWMDRSFLKIRNVSLGYTFPKSILRDTPVSALRLYIQARNLGSIFNNSEVRDMDTGNTYYNRGFTFGVNVTF